MADTINKDTLREFMGLQNVASITDDQLLQALNDARTIKTKFGDELLIKYYAAWLMSKSIDWNTLAANADVKFNKPNPDTYKTLYDERESDIFYTTFDVEA